MITILNQFFSSQKRFIYLLALTMIVLSFGSYWQTLNIGYLSDDWGYVYLGQRELPGRALYYLFHVDVYGNGGGNFRPLQTMVTLLLWKQWFAVPAFLHATSIFLHAVVSTLFGVFCYELMHRKDVAFFAAVIFVLHPLNTEVVAWLSAANALVATIPLLLAMILYVKRPDELSVVSPTMLAICTLLLVSLLAKEHALVFPFLAFVFDRLQKRNWTFRHILVFVFVDVVYFTWRFSVLHRLGGYVMANSNSAHTAINFHNIRLYAELPLLYVYNFFNTAITPSVLAWSARLFVGVSIIIFGRLLIRAARQQTVKLAHALLPIIALIALVYIANLLGWNLVNPRNAFTEHSRILYVSTMFASLLFAYVFFHFERWSLQVTGIVYCLMLFILNQYQVQPWIQAGKTAHEINRQLERTLQQHPDVQELEITHLPDQYYGAFIYRNGIEYATALMANKGKGDVRVKKTMQPGIAQTINIMVVQ